MADAVHRVIHDISSKVVVVVALCLLVHWHVNVVGRSGENVNWRVLEVGSVIDQAFRLKRVCLAYGPHELICSEELASEMLVTIHATCQHAGTLDVV